MADSQVIPFGFGTPPPDFCFSSPASAVFGPGMFLFQPQHAGVAPAIATLRANAEYAGLAVHGCAVGENAFPRFSS